MRYEGSLGYFRYEGALVEEGFLDARKSAAALICIDSALRHFVDKDHPEFQVMNYEIPVRIRKGSWEVLIPKTIGEWILTGSGIAFSAYLTTAATKMAENDFKEASVRKSFGKAISSLQWIIKIGKHTGSIVNKKFDKVKFSESNRQIGIPSPNNDYLFVPKEHFDNYIHSSPKMLEDLARFIEEKRTLVIGLVEDESIKEVKIGFEHKGIFIDVSDDEELFPDLKHGDQVALEGDITRGNENSNSLGFRYDGHILTCYPAKGSIVKYKNTLFSKCIMKGIISRLDKFGNTTEKRPKILFTDIITLEVETNASLFQE